MAYQIVRISPTYDRSTDAIIGSHVSWRSHAYATSALALKLAAVAMAREEAYSDDSLVVVPFDGSPFGRGRRIVVEVADTDDEIPF